MEWQANGEWETFSSEKDIKWRENLRLNTIYPHIQDDNFIFLVPFLYRSIVVVVVIVCEGVNGLYWNVPWDLEFFKKSYSLTLAIHHSCSHFLLIRTKKQPEEALAKGYLR